MKNESTQTVELEIAGSSTYGRDPKIQASRTYNMILADDWLVDYFGYEKVVHLSDSGKGRGIFSSIIADRLIIVVSNKVYSIGVYGTSSTGTRTYTTASIGTINSFSGDVFMDENIAGQIAICDQHDLYIYNYNNSTFQKATLPDGIVPGYVCYQDGYFIVPNAVGSTWALSAQNDGLSWNWGASGKPVSAAIQTKANFAKATLRVPGAGNLLFVMGNYVTELWTDVGAASFPYQKSYSVNVDYGCINAATIASQESIICWLGSNEKSGPVILYSSGAEVKQLSSDGINYKLATLVEPENSAGFFMKLSGHLIYQLTFYNPKDNYTLLYDFTTGKFFDATDENMNFHIARRVAFFNNEYYFVSFNDGNLYRMSEQIYTFDYSNRDSQIINVKEIPRIRVANNIRLPTQERFIINNAAFTVEQGNDTDNTGNNPNYYPGIDMSVSQNGGISFGSYVRQPIYKVGNRMNKLVWWNCGSTNDFVAQFRFWGKGPWKCTNGTVDIYK